jgi:Domain of unknown function (DUF4836)
MTRGYADCMTPLKNNLLVMKKLICLLLAFLAITSSHAQSIPTDNTLFRHIPADADQVYDIHIASLIAKADLMSLLKMAQGQKMGKDNPFSMLSDVSNTGIDMRQDIIIAVKTTANTDSPTLITVIAHLIDSGKLASFIRDHDKDKHIIHLPGKERVAASNSTATAWTDKIVTLVIVKHPKGQTVDPATAAKDRLAAAHRSAAVLHGFDHSFYATNEKFRNGFSDDADVHIFNHNGSGYGALSKLMMMSPAAASPQAGDFSKFMKKAPKANSLSTLRFLPGKLVFQTTRFLTGDDSAIAARLLASPVSDKLLASVPSGKVLGLIALHYDLSAVTDNLHKYGVDTKLDSGLSAKGLTMQTLFHAFTGDLLLVATLADTGKAPLIYGAAGIGDKTDFDKVANLLKPAAPAAGDTTPPKKQHIFVSTSNNIAVLSGTQQRADAWFNSSANTNPTRLVTPELRHDAFFFAIDMQVGADCLAKVLTKGDTIAAKDQKLLDVIRQFDSFVIGCPSGQQGQTQMTFELNFTDRNKNALASLMEIAAAAAKAKNGN